MSGEISEGQLYHWHILATACKYIYSKLHTHKLPCLEGALVFTSQKEARDWQRHWLARKGWMGGARWTLGRQEKGCGSLLTSQYVELHEQKAYAQACRSFSLVFETGSYSCILKVASIFHSSGYITLKMCTLKLMCYIQVLHFYLWLHVHVLPPTLHQ